MCQIILSDWNYLVYKRKELFSFMKSTRDKEEYRRASAIKQKMEKYIQTIARNLGVNYRNVYDWINNYRKDGLDGIRNKRKNGGRKPVISSDRNKEMIKEVVGPEQVTQNIWLSQEYMEYQALGYISFLTIGNECQSNADVENNSGFGCSIQTTKT